MEEQPKFSTEKNLSKESLAEGEILVDLNPEERKELRNVLSSLGAKLVPEGES